MPGGQWHHLSIILCGADRCWRRRGLLFYAVDAAGAIAKAHQFFAHSHEILSVEYIGPSE